MHSPLLQDVVIILSCGVAVVLLFQRLRIPSILGLLVTGILIGPHGLSLVTAIEEVEVLSEIGVILLLFVIGMELSLKQLITMRRTVFVGGSLQVGLSVAVATGGFFLAGHSLPEAVFIGFLVALSSTAIVLKLLQENNEVGAPHGRVALGVLIYQDIIVVPMMLVTPLLAGGEGSVWRELGMLVLKSALVGGGVFFGARYGVPRLLHLVAQTKNQGLFVLTTIAVCFAVAALTAVAGLSLALGAFLAGLIVSESDYSHQATSTILPFRELFTSFFFVSIGMLLEVPFFLAHLHIIVPAVVVVFLVKSSLAGLATAALGYPRRTVLLSGLALFQIGEFAFILSRVGYRYDLLSGSLNQYFLSISILSMALTPFVLAKAHRLVDWLLRKTPSPAPEPVPVEAATAPVTEHAPTAEHAPGRLEHHLIIIGFGLNGRNVARAARYAGIPYVVLELNADTVAQERERGEPIMFGDPVQPHVLEEVAIERAQVVVIAISDPKATQRIVSNIRTLCGTVHVLVRSRFINEIEPLRRLGANEVIPEEFETSVEIFARTMQHFFVPADQIESMVHQVRADNYEMLRPQPVPPTSGSATALPAFNIQCVVIKADSGKVAGKTIAESQLRRRYGVTVLAIDRSGTLIHNVMPDERLQRDDKVYISGHQKAIDAFYKAVS